MRKEEILERNRRKEKESNRVNGSKSPKETKNNAYAMHESKER